MRLPRRLLNALATIHFPGSARYWEWRYASGGDSGEGSYGAEAGYKRDFINGCLAEHGIRSVIDFGCGDGNQLQGMTLPEYRGFDVSRAAVARCRAAYAGDAGKSFHHVDEYRGDTADAALSLDVLYHLTEDEVFDDYLDRLFGAAERLVIIYAVDQDERRVLKGRHVRFRRFTDTIARRFPEFLLVASPPRPEHLVKVSGESGASFFVFERSVPCKPK